MANRRGTTNKTRQFSPNPQENKKHPDEWERDLNPNSREGQNIGRQATSDNPRARTAADVKELTEILSDFSQEELREIPIVPPGSALKEGAVYMDLRNPALGPFVATGGRKAAEGNLFAPKAEVPYEYWNRLVQSLCPDPIREKENPDDKTLSESMIDKTLADSFPTSDLPSWTGGRDKH